jgi:23S rRNA (uracil1939-C5)-methyltransferase
MSQGKRGESRSSEIAVPLEAMTYGGEAIGRVDGKIIFVQGGIAGERVRAAVTDDRRRFARARVVEVIDASPHRVRPRCPHFGFDPTSCGGCQWQHIDTAAQMRFKADIVREQLERIGRIERASVRETIPSPDAWAYRNHARFGVTAEGQAGFQAARSNRIVPIGECHIVRPPIAEWLRASRQAHSGADWIDVRTSGDGDVTVWEGRLASNLQPFGCAHALSAAARRGRARRGRPPSSSYLIKGAAFQVSAASFFQVNTSLIETLVDLVLGGIRLSGGETVLDAYCGVGLFSRFLAPIAGRVIGIESSASAVADARENLSMFDNVELREGLVESALPGVGDRLDAVVVDPPRAGCAPKVIEAIIRRQVKRLVYVSCDPSTLARDARRLIDGGYELIDVQPLDMFPHTYHIECVARFERAGDAPTAGSGYTRA